MMSVECELLSEELARYDVSVEQIEVDGETYRPTLTSTETYLSGAGPVTIMRHLYRPVGRGSKSICPLELRAGIVAGYFTPRATRQATFVTASGDEPLIFRTKDRLSSYVAEPGNSRSRNFFRAISDPKYSMMDMIGGIHHQGENQHANETSITRARPPSPTDRLGKGIFRYGQALFWELENALCWGAGSTQSEDDHLSTG